MPRFPFYLLRCHRRRLRGFRIFEARSVPRNQSTYSPIFRRISPAGNSRSHPRARFIFRWRRTLRVRCRSAGNSSTHLASYFAPLAGIPSLFFSRSKRELSSSALSRATGKKLCRGATTEGAVMRTWVASMDRFDVLVDAGNSPLLPSTATRYRSRRARTSKLDLSFFDRLPVARSFLLHLLPLVL